MGGGLAEWNFKPFLQRSSSQTILCQNSSIFGCQESITASVLFEGSQGRGIVLILVVKGGLKKAKKKSVADTERCC